MPFHRFILGDEGWRIQGEEVLFANPYIEVHRVELTSPVRSQSFQWTVAYRKGAVVVVPRTEDGRFLLVRQERVPIQASLWEFPAGQIDEGGKHSWEVICGAGRREMREETGYELGVSGEIISLGHFFSSAGFTDEHSHLLLMSPVVPSPQGSAHDSGEAITEVRGFTLGEFEGMIASGEIRDANTLSAYARMTAMGLLR